MLKQIDNPEISSNFQSRMMNNARDQREFSNIAQRLMRRAHAEIIIVPLDGGLEIEVYVPTDSEVIELLKLQADIYRAGMSFQSGGQDIDTLGTEVDMVAEGYDRLNRLLGKICVDPSLSYEFFASGQISTRDKTAIITGVISNINEKREMVSRFR